MSVFVFAIHSIIMFFLRYENEIFILYPLSTDSEKK